ncbi:MAG: DUF5996 family protein [Elainellaceae cyanobacterium]
MRSPPQPLYCRSAQSADDVAKEAYNQEMSSAGFWPGAGLGYPAFYSYAYPTPDGFEDAVVEPEAAFYTAPTMQQRPWQIGIRRPCGRRGLNPKALHGIE